MAIRLKVREFAEDRNINKAQLARRADLGTTTVNEIWDGSRQDVRLSTLWAIAQVFGVKVCDLIEDDGEPGLFPDILENKINARDLVAA